MRGRVLASAILLAALVGLGLASWEEGEKAPPPLASATAAGTAGERTEHPAPSGRLAEVATLLEPERGHSTGPVPAPNESSTEPPVTREALLELMGAAVGSRTDLEEGMDAVRARELAEDALANIRDPSLAPLLERIATEDLDRQRRILAADLLAEIDPERARTLCVRFLRGAVDEGLRLFAAVSLARLPRDVEARAALEAALASDPSPAVRRLAEIACAHGYAEKSR